MPLDLPPEMADRLRNAFRLSDGDAAGERQISLHADGAPTYIYADVLPLDVPQRRVRTVGLAEAMIPRNVATSYAAVCSDGWAAYGMIDGPGLRFGVGILAATRDSLSHMVRIGARPGPLHLMLRNHSEVSKTLSRLAARRGAETSRHWFGDLDLLKEVRGRLRHHSIEITAVTRRYGSDPGKNRLPDQPYLATAVRLANAVTYAWRTGVNPDTGWLAAQASHTARNRSNMKRSRDAPPGTPIGPPAFDHQ